MGVFGTRVENDNVQFPTEPFSGRPCEQSRHTALSSNMVTSIIWQVSDKKVTSSSAAGPVPERFALNSSKVSTFSKSTTDLDQIDAVNVREP